VTDPGRPAELQTKVYGELTIYNNRWVRVSLVDIEPPDGNRFEHHVVRLQTVALTAVIDEQDRVLMPWRHRFVTGEWGWELPGGIVEAGESPTECALREVVEETGWKPESVTPLLSYQPMSGLVDTPHHIFLGRNACVSVSRRTWRKPALSTGSRLRE
jgi:8-oxo-dGDP phosphatase